MAGPTNNSSHSAPNPRDFNKEFAELAEQLFGEHPGEQPLREEELHRPESPMTAEPSPATSRQSGPRDWTPGEFDERFDPSDIPFEAAAPPSNGLLAGLLGALAGFLVVLFILGGLGVFVFPRLVWFTFGIAGFAAAAGAVFFLAPWEHDPDDDGARL